ncbi:MAG: S41 family peptidase [Rhizobacter sp.]|jgi:carboxyl-terminal processing protease
MGSKLKVAGWVTLGAVAGALTTMQLQATARNTASQFPLEEIQQLSNVFELVKSTYVVPVDEKKLITDAIGGMVAGLDPHSQYIEQKSVKEFSEGITGRFVGVGIEIGMEDGLVKVITPIEGSPAFKAGIKSGDLITKVDDTQVKGLTVEQAVKKMRGEPNTKVVLTIFRKSESRSFTVPIIRAEIQAQSVRAKVVEPGYAWVQVRQFQDKTVEDFVRKVDEVYKQDPNLKGLVLDLRNDPGGSVVASVAIASAFLPPDVVVVSTKGQLASSKSVLKATPKDYLYYEGRGLLRTLPPDPLRRLPAAIKTVPMVVLVNEGSASASEIVAGALQDHKRAVIMGAQTFGKGSVQTLICLGPEPQRIDRCPSAAIKITTARYYTPADRSIQAKGIVPDIMLDETAEGPLYSALRTREADLDKHLQSGQGEEEKDLAREKAREEARKRYEEEAAKAGKSPLKQPPELGSPEDFPLMQALNQLKNKPVQVSKTATERKPEDATTSQ